ncbi:MAG: GtrA family protein [Xanthomonadales bacterium]|nr:GtrA family protein [Xanthomonadales bacterium]MCP5475418.1 GtrA family protein [Rhodanobacteraceae bacterium]
MLKQGMRFLVIGAFNTSITYGLYCLLVFWWHPQLAFLTVFCIGLAMGYFLHTRVVFQGRLGRRKAVGYIVVQLAMYALSSAVIHFSMNGLGVGPRTAGAIAIVINVPISFLLSRRILSDPPASSVAG